MSFCFNFDVDAPTNTQDMLGNASLNDKIDRVVKRVNDSGNPEETVKEAKEHFPPSDPQHLLDDAISETLTIGSLPPLHFLNETVFEKTIYEREDTENVLSRTAEQRSDLISGVYEGGLKVWECTYDLLEVIEREGETFGGKGILDLGCGAGLLGILSLKRGANKVHFQDYNSTVIEQLTMSNVIINCQDDDGEDDEQGKGKGIRKTDKENDKCKTKAKHDRKDLLPRCRFFSGDWRTFLTLVSSQDPPLKYDIIMTSETIYNTAYYLALHNTFHKLLAPQGRVYLATKSHYFGVGGGLHLFETFVAEQGVFKVNHLWDSENGLQRHVVTLHFKKELQ
ncbi:histidine protein methyltransferase 1 homolog [Corythoichthys intestinalis]|uniref:histidine protein methyltransferase 1 homolog n=1 Tax=Corythoichthys intestinalis TaxID=161448 RepID=UPI0025A5EBB4|nr:histidine protein methyltransferase 1 homolog [Corythoichthys intestinalis]